MMWVLILTSGTITRPPAVIGGYLSREEAERAGDLATAYDSSATVYPEFQNYTVIPGAAQSGPVGSTHSRVIRDYDYAAGNMIVTRCTDRWPK